MLKDWLILYSSEENKEKEKNNNNEKNNKKEKIEKENKNNKKEKNNIRKDIDEYEYEFENSINVSKISKNGNKKEEKKKEGDEVREQKRKYQKKIDYKKQIEEVEKCRVDYMELQGNIFASEDEFERDCTNEFKKFVIDFITHCKNFFKDFEINPDIQQKIDNIDGAKDNKEFAEKYKDDDKIINTSKNISVEKNMSKNMNENNNRIIVQNIREEIEDKNIGEQSDEKKIKALEEKIDAENEKPAVINAYDLPDDF